MQTSVDNWMGELANRSDATREKYKQYLMGFCKFAGMMPEGSSRRAGQTSGLKILGTSGGWSLCLKRRFSVY